MDHVNKTLLLSLKQDLLSLNESIERLRLDSDVASWLFPTKNYQFVKQYIKEKKIFEVNNVKIILELIIDRLYVGIRLILIIIQDKVKLIDFGKYLVHQPQQMTIGCGFENLRKMIGIFIEKLADQNLEIENSECTNKNKTVATKKHTGTQTEIISLAKCDSCASAMSCMKNLLILFEIHKDDIYQTEQLNSNVYGLTQFGCMMQTAITVEKSLKTVLEKLLNKENENEELTQNIKSLKKDLYRKDGIIALLEKECEVLNEKNKRNSSDMTFLKSKIDVLNSNVSKSDIYTSYLNDCICSLNSKITQYKNESEMLIQQKLDLLGNLEKVKKTFQQVFQKLLALEINLQNIEKEYQIFSEMFGIFSNGLDSVNQTLAAVSKNHNALENKVKILCCDSVENATNLAKNFKIFQEKIQQMVIESRINDVKTTEPIPKIQIKGNPMEDISKQIEENNERIRMLQIENVKLENIVSKFKNIKK